MGKQFPTHSRFVNGKKPFQFKDIRTKHIINFEKRGTAALLVPPAIESVTSTSIESVHYSTVPSTSLESVTAVTMT